MLLNFTLNRFELYYLGEVLNRLELYYLGCQKNYQSYVYLVVLVQQNCINHILSELIGLGSSDRVWVKDLTHDKEVGFALCIFKLGQLFCQTQIEDINSNGHS